MKCLCRNKNETVKAGFDFGKALKGGAVVLLEGDLGAGKTTFTKGVAKALKISEDVLSPTFTIMNEYQGRLRLCHFDAYRLKNGEEAVFAGVAENIGEKNTVCVIEWFENIYDILPKDAARVSIKYVDETTREIEIG